MESVDNIVFARKDEPVARELLQKDIVRMQTPDAFLEVRILTQEQPDLCFQAALLFGQLEKVQQPTLAPHG